MSTAESPAPLKRTNTVITIVATIVGTVIAFLSLAAAVKWPPFQDTEKVTVTKGEQVQGYDNCTVEACRYISVQLEGFTAHSTVRCTFDSSQGPDAFGAYVATVDGDGNHAGRTDNYYGTPGGWVSATCEGFTGALNPW